MYENFQNQVIEAWTVTIIDEYQKIKDSCKLLASLKPPNFAISAEFTRKLGTWDYQTRTITLAQYLFVSGTWDDIINTLKHEMAHQIVDELFKTVDETPHGDAFKKACKILNISPKASISFKPETSSIHRKIIKLFALGKSPNKHESERALKKAHELCLKYNINLDSKTKMSDYGIRLLDPLFKRTPSYIWGITKILNDFYFVQYIRRPFHNNSSKTSKRTTKIIELYGLPKNLDIAEYVYYFLLHNSEMEWKHYKRTKKLTNNKQKNSFMIGLYNGLHKKLTLQNEKLAPDQSLIYLGDSQLNEFYRARNPYIRRSCNYAKSYKDAHSDGSKIGEKMAIKPGINPSKPPFKIEEPLLK